MRLSTAPELPRINSKSSDRAQIVRNSMPFSNIMKEIQLESLLATQNLKARSDAIKDRKNSQEVFVPSGLKTYNEGTLQELTVRSRFKQDEYKDRYTKIIRNNPHAFYKLTGEFTLYSDFSVKINRAGPYNKRK
ncbi:hypothetical protein SteCoe_38277 [Stentor coeruleus]|uniref:Uncharacterized protein n=1 Tax=Stentor coeruleus TaxID=5963 RepID=A0A1R2ALN6_9CILI|nr:hypothetical protein SteCoe_38277 [Stentor coeruleus]